jgi:cytochrome c oxidase subunit 1/cytochrome c oxidase subunit I+III
MRRRVYTYAAGDHLTTVNALATIGALVLALGILVSIVNLLRSLRAGAPAGPDPWRAETLEWAIASPPPPYAFARLPLVASRSPLWDGTDPFDDPHDARVLATERLTLATSAVDAAPRAVARMAEDSIAPLLLALALLAVFAAALLKAPWLGLAAVLVSLAMTALWLWPKPEVGPA